MGHIHRRKGFEGGIRTANARLQARLAFLLGFLWQPGHGFRHIGRGGKVRFFTIAVLPSNSAQVTVLANNVALERGEDRPCHNGV